VAAVLRFSDLVTSSLLAGALQYQQLMYIFNQSSIATSEPRVHYSRVNEKILVNPDCTASLVKLPKTTHLAHPQNTIGEYRKQTSAKL
jgi:hypothetical protein